MLPVFLDCSVFMQYLVPNVMCFWIVLSSCSILCLMLPVFLDCSVFMQYLMPNVACVSGLFCLHAVSYA